ncbi:C2 family cysteine protease [Streptomyces sp. NPDC088560]|uniref:C2 family cysteine protease n=1 Tax=Streptomyces sp. NPDC088560 TaxID=3365868 RepID=UPI00382FB443
MGTPVWPKHQDLQSFVSDQYNLRYNLRYREELSHAVIVSAAHAPVKLPKVVESGFNTRYRPPFFFAGSGLPKYTDVKQGRLGDCWLLATLASMAYAYPQYVKSMFREVGSGRFEVALREKVNVGNVLPHYRIPSGDQTPIARNDEVSWVALAEKGGGEAAGS